MARRKKAAHAENHERWLLTYADLITLLLVFFVVLYSISKADTEKFKQVSSSLQQAFNVDVLKEPDRTTDAGAAAQTDARLVAYLSVRGQVQALMAKLQVTAGAIDIELNNQGVVLHLSDALLFAPGSAELRPEAARLLNGIAAIIDPMPNQIRVEGHTDNVPPAPDSPYTDNWQLSAMRAVATVRYLTDVHDLAPNRLAAVGYGEYQPRADNSTIEGRRKNRRVDFVLVAPTGGPDVVGSPAGEP